MSKLLQRLFLFEKCEIQTEFPKQEVLSRVASFIDSEQTDYYGSLSADGFFIGEKNIKHSTFVRTRNSFAPIAKAKIIEENGITTVSVVLRMHLLVMILFVPFYVVSLLTVVMFPFVLGLLHFAFLKPAKKLKQKIENLLICSLS